MNQYRFSTLATVFQSETNGRNYYNNYNNYYNYYKKNQKKVGEPHPPVVACFAPKRTPKNSPLPAPTPGFVYPILGGPKNF